MINYEEFEDGARKLSQVSTQIVDSLSCLEIAPEAYLQTNDISKRYASVICEKANPKKEFTKLVVRSFDDCLILALISDEFDCHIDFITKSKQLATSLVNKSPSISIKDKEDWVYKISNNHVDTRKLGKLIKILMTEKVKLELLNGMVNEKNCNINIKEMSEEEILVLTNYFHRLFGLDINCRKEP